MLQMLYSFRNLLGMGGSVLRSVFVCGTWLCWLAVIRVNGGLTW